MFWTLIVVMDGQVQGRGADPATAQQIVGMITAIEGDEVDGCALLIIFLGKPVCSLWHLQLEPCPPARLTVLGDRNSGD